MTNTPLALQTIPAAPPRFSGLQVCASPRTPRGRPYALGYRSCVPLCALGGIVAAPARDCRSFETYLAHVALAEEARARLPRAS